MKLKKIFSVLIPTLCLFFSSSLVAYSSQGMSLEEKIGQLLMVHFNGEEVNEEAKTLVQKVRVGGIIYYNWANGLSSREQVSHLSKNLQQLAIENPSSIPLLLAVDQEGGGVTRLVEEFTIFPGNKALGLSGDPALAEEAAFAMGQEMRMAGINMNLAPVVDINSNPRNPVIGIRSFGDSPDLVTAFGKKALAGFHKAGILATLKHFPGHGEIDSHEDLPFLKKSKKELEKMEFAPFSALIHETDAVMTAHLMIPSLDSQNCATLSKKILHILRKEMGFEGVIISDSLLMKGLLKNSTSVEEGAIQALNAGCDLLLLGGKQLVQAEREWTAADVERVHHALIHAVHSKRISKKRVEEALQRVLHLKNRLLSADEKEKKEEIDFEEHEVLAKKIASLGIKTIASQSFPFSPNRFAVFAPKTVEKAIEQTSLFMRREEISSLFFDCNPTEEEIQTSCEMAKEADLLIFCSYNAWNTNEQSALLRSLLQLKKPTVLIVLRDSLDALLFPEVDLVILTHSPSAPSIEAACDQLQSFLQIKG